MQTTDRSALRRLLEQRARKPKHLPVSFAQQRLWFLDQLQPGSAQYNVHQAMRLRGTLDRLALERALDEVVRRHESLRTTLALIGDEPAQVVAPPSHRALPYVDLSGLDDGEAEMMRQAEAEAASPFDLSAGPLFRARLIKVRHDEHVLLLTMHHVVSDGWSMAVLVRECVALYLAYAAGAPSPLPELPLQYADFAVWQRQWLAGNGLDGQLAYWKRRLEGASGVLDLPTSRPRPARSSGGGARKDIAFDAAFTEALRSLARRQGATLFMTLLAGFGALLSRYSGQTDVIVGAPIANRNRPEVEGLIGYFVNMLPLRIDFAHDPRFVDVLGQVRDRSLEAYAHQDMPLEKLVDELQVPRAENRTPLFQTAFVLQNTPLADVQIPGLELAPIEIATGTSKFDLLLELKETPDGLVGNLEYATDIFDAAAIDRMVSHWQNLLTAVVSNEAVRLLDVPLLSAEERHTIVHAWNDASADYPHDVCIHALVEAQARRTPDATAVVEGDESLSYRTLNERANRVAHALRARGLCAGERVAVLMDRSSWAVVALLAVWKAGGVYVPVDPEWPDTRLRDVLESVGVRRVLTTRARCRRAERFEAIVLDGDESAAFPGDDLPASALPEGEAYVIFTSGSTGKPKGVVVQHRALVNMVTCTNRLFGLGQEDRFLFAGSLGFDLSIYDMVGPLVAGATIVVAPPAVTGEPRKLVELLCDAGITVWHSATALFVQLLDDLPEAPGLKTQSLRWVLIGGETMPLRLPETVGAVFPRAKVVNIGGATESTVWSNYYVVDRVEPGWASIPYGRPLPNVQYHVLDAALNPCPIGVRGELFIAGDAVAFGYANDPSLTARKFLPNPFSKVPGARMYATGDIARYLPDGVLDFVGRVDHQIKLRGFRIELGEIESVLAQHPCVAECAVLVKGKRLVAYVTGRDGAALEARQLGEHAAGRLPGYMVPAVFVQLEALPLTSNGKVDRAALPEPPAESAGTELLLPRTELESKLAAIWSEVLDVSRLGVTQDFFDLGGDSLLATRLVSRVRRELEVELPLRALFGAPTVAGLATVVEQARGADAPIAGRFERVPRERARLSFPQERMWFLEQLYPGTATQNVPLVLRLEGLLPLAVLERALAELSARHESLRTTFTAERGEPWQIIHPAGQKAPLHLVDLSALAPEERAREVEQVLEREAGVLFDLEAGPLWKVTLVREAEERHLLVINLHHLVTDGWSMGVLVRELESIYRAFAAGSSSPLPPPSVQYSDFAHWQRTTLHEEALAPLLAYWKAHLDGAPRVLDLPLDRPRGASVDQPGAIFPVTLPSGLGERLRALCLEEGASSFMALLAAYALLLGRYARQERVVIGSPIANRHHQELEGVVGLLVNTLPLKVDLEGDPSFRELLRRVRDVALGAYAHQDLPFEKLVEAIQPDRNLKTSPIFQAMFVLHNYPFAPPALEGLRVAAIDPPRNNARFDLTLVLFESGGGFEGGLEYSTALFDEETVRDMVAHLVRLLEAVVARPEHRVSELSLRLPPDEERQLFAGWCRSNAHVDAPASRLRVHQLFERQAIETPNAIALQVGDRTLTYRELDARARRLAGRLVQLGVKPDVPVAIALERSVEMVVAVLAVLKAGGAYVPLDPAHPVERSAYVLEDSNARVLITQASLRERFATTRARVLDVNEDAEAPPHHAQAPAGGSLAYVLYTSGSTGRPKGVQVTHEALTNVILSMQDELALTAADRLLAVATLAFDIAALELYVPLMVGARIVLADQATVSDAHRLLQVLETSGITFMQATPSMWRMLIEAGLGAVPELKVLCGGEALSRDLADALRSRAGRGVWNGYGPTEVTIYSTTSEVPAAGPVCIGHPVANIETYILDERLDPVPVGVPGQLALGGIGLARGYLGRPDLTAERFVPHPFGPPGSRLYLTGDLVRWRRDGGHEFLGRMDSQIKLRGYRIELGEIESVLEQHPAIGEAVAAIRDDRGEAILCAYFHAKDGAPSPTDLRRFLRRQLPEYMVPAAFVAIEAWPLSPNGKIDRRALPAPRRTGDENHMPPETPTEVALAECWRTLLGAERVGRTDDFFDLGGHSLLAVRLVAAIQERFGTTVHLRSLFTAPQLAELAAKIDGGGDTHARGSSLVAFGGGPGPAIFWVHPIGGSVFCYAELARALKPDIAFFALQARGLDGEATPRDRIEGMAAAYLADLRRAQPKGPYHLGGWSMGGVVAFEMAQQLLAAGETVASLVLLDSHPRPFQSEEASREAIAEDFQQLLPEGAGMPPEHVLRTYEANARALSNYQLRAYTGKIVLIAADAHVAILSDTWQRTTDLAIESHALAADHYGLVKSPHVQAVADLVRRASMPEEEA
ncbi:amino acid adenylation domain-containing protein [Pendulispora brunnea]|uniref:Amino acid adenylation domain-containing protein n=1 Tax=Pendulispora brunnea TaxID=2905690 RepID=A0ABZ2KNV3_9BACT